MREARLILPVADNEGRTLNRVHQELRTRLCKEFGGFTAVAAIGGWLNGRTGEVIEEAGISYLVATDRVDADEKLRELAQWAGAEARQEAMYTRHADGRVVIIPIASATASQPSMGTRTSTVADVARSLALHLQNRIHEWRRHGALRKRMPKALPSG